MAIVRNFFAGIGCLTLLAILALAAWLYRDEIVEWVESRNAIEMSAPSEELAALAEEKIGQLRDGTAPDEVRFSEMELQSYVQFRLIERLPDGVYAPAVDLKDSTIAVSAELDLVRLAATVEAADGLRRFLGDSTRVLTEVYPEILDDGSGVLTILSLQAGVVPVPPIAIPALIDRAGDIGIKAEGNRVLFPLEGAYRSIRVAADEVVLSTSARAAGSLP